MVLRISIGLVLLVALATVQAAQIQPAAAGDDDEISDEDIEFEFTVGRTFHDDDDESDEDSYEEYDYYLDNLSPERREEIEKEPYKRFSKWQQGWRTYPLYVIILGG